MTKLTIVIPVYNDRDSIVETYNNLTRVMSAAAFEWELLFIDDGSKDNPKEVFEANGVPYIQHETNKGYGAAIKTGVQAAKGEFVAIIDCDGTYPAEAILDLMPHAETYDQVVGARDVRINPPLHIFTKLLVCYLLSALFNQDVKDINSGLRIFRRSTFLTLMPGVGDRFSLTSSTTYGFLLNDIPIKYVPIQYFKRVGQSHVRRWSFTKQFFSSLTRMWKHSRKLRDEGIEVVPPEKKNPASRQCNKGAEVLFQLFLIIAGTLLGTWFLWPQITNFYSVQDDVAQHSYWMVSYRDPELFKNDIYLAYARSLTTPAVDWIYRVAVQFFAPVNIGKFLCVFLFGITGWLLYLVGKSVWNRYCGVAMAFFFVGFPFNIDRFEAGLHRAFMFPLLAFYIYVLVSKRFHWIGLALALGLLFYPPAFVISLVVTIVFLIFNWRAILPTFRGRMAIAGWLLLVTAISITYVQRKAHKPDFLGPMSTGQEMAEDPRYNLGGRSEYLPFNTPNYFMRRYMFQRDNHFVQGWMIAAPLFLLLLVVRGRSAVRVAWPIIAFFGVSYALYVIAEIVHFKLYIPERYIRFSSVLTSCILTGLGVSAAIALFRTPVQKTIALILLCFWGAADSKQPSVDFMNQVHYNVADYAPLLHYLEENTPKDTIIAADPFFSDAISIYSRRVVLLKYELCHPWYRDYRHQMEERAHDYYAAVYATNLDAIRALRDKYGVKYMLFEANLYSKGNVGIDRLFYEPIRSEIRYKYQRDLDKDFIMKRLAEKLTIYEFGRYQLVPIDEESLKKFGQQVTSSV
ncbi:glycosyltransferase family 2 protein [Candidatus Sumerlaeota bacterium]|nr:glycosyltransferase family 2 protein [Candidatus Sumerlaeota bacterium]